MSSLLRGRNGAGVEAAPDAIAPARDDTIAQVAHRPGNPAEHFADRRPRTWQNGEQRDGRIGTNEHLLRSAPGSRTTRMVVELRARSDRRAARELSYFGRLGRRKTQAVAAVAAQEPANRSITKTAMAIEDDQQPTIKFLKTVHYQRDAGAARCDSIRRVPARDAFYTEPTMSHQDLRFQPHPFPSPSAARRALFPRRREFAGAGIPRRGRRTSFC